MNLIKTYRRAAVAAVPAVALLFHACTQPLTLEDVLVRPTAMAAVGATSVTVTAGAVVTNPARVRVLDQSNGILPNQDVSFAFSRGTPASATAATNAQGEAAPASWTAPNQAGAATITASIPGFTVPNVVFQVTVNPGPATTQTAVATTNNRSAIAGTPVDFPPEVLVADQFGNGIQGVVVTFTVQTAGSTVNGTTATTATVTTGTNGLAKLTSWVLRGAIGVNTLQATTAVLPAQPITFTATGTIGPVNRIVIAPGAPSSQNQTAVGGTNVPVAPSVLVTDANNNPIANVVARFTVTAGGGKVLANSGDATGSTFLDATTNASGIATIFGWRLGAVGANSLTVSIPSVTGVTFVINATGTAGPPATIAVVTETPSSNNQTAIVNTTVQVAPGVVVRDANGNPVRNTSVTFAVGANSGTFKTTSASADLASGTIVTDSNGVARLFSWKLANRGANTLTATVTANTSITLTFTAEGIPGAAASIQIVTETPSSNNQTTIANTATPVAPGVIVRDANNLTVNTGTEIVFTITNGGGVVSALGCTGTATSAIVDTDENGIARLGCWKPGTVSPGNTVRAEVVGTPSLFVIFTATGTVGPPVSVSFTIQPWSFTRQSFPNRSQGPKVVVRDTGGNGVSGSTINWSNNGNANGTTGGTLTSVTTASGEATFTGTLTAAGAVGTTMQLRADVQATALNAVSTSVLIVGAPTSTLTVTPAPPTTTVNTIVSPNPVLVVRDASLNPVPDVQVTWSYPVNPNGNGTIEVSIVLPDSLGRTSPGANWRVSQTAGTNTVQATISGLAPHTFTTTGVAGPATQIAINAGNAQTAPTSTAVTTPPSVIVRDQFSNVVSSVGVTFSPTTGSGSVTGSPTNTNASGIATVGSWTLGPTAGTHQLQALLTSTPSVITTFSATATSTDPCLSSTPYTIGTTVNGTLAASDCTVNGRFGDIYSFTTTAATTQLSLSENSFGAFEPTLWSNIWTGGTWGWRSGAVADSVTARLIVAPGSYTFRASSEVTSTTGAYRVSSVLNPTQPTGCGYFLTTKGITVTHTLDGGCSYTTATQTVPATANSKAYIMFLPAGQTATVKMNAGTLPDPYLECFLVSTPASFSAPTFITGCVDDDSGGGTNSLLTIPIAATDRYIMIRASHFNTSTATGTYTFIIDP